MASRSRSRTSMPSASPMPAADDDDDDLDTPADATGLDTSRLRRNVKLDGSIDIAGYLRRRNAGSKTWVLRYCVLNNDLLLLFNKETDKSASVIISILNGAIEETHVFDTKVKTPSDDLLRCSFLLFTPFHVNDESVKVDERNIEFLADSYELKKIWVESLNQVIKTKLRLHRNPSFFFGDFKIIDNFMPAALFMLEQGKSVKAPAGIWVLKSDSVVVSEPEVVRKEEDRMDFQRFLNPSASSLSAENKRHRAEAGGVAEVVFSRPWSGSILIVNMHDLRSSLLVQPYAILAFSTDVEVSFAYLRCSQNTFAFRRLIGVGMVLLKAGGGLFTRELRYGDQLEVRDLRYLLAIEGTIHIFQTGTLSVLLSGEGIVHLQTQYPELG